MKCARPIRASRPARPSALSRPTRAGQGLLALASLSLLLALGGIPGLVSPSLAADSAGDSRYSTKTTEQTPSGRFAALVAGALLLTPFAANSTRRLVRKNADWFGTAPTPEEPAENDRRPAPKRA